MAFTKNKSKSTNHSEIHFVSSMQLEQSVMLVESLADEHHQITLSEVHPDEFQFEVILVRDELGRASIEGTLQRWNGTETRMDARTSIAYAQVKTKAHKRSGFLGLALVFGIFVAIALCGVYARLALPALLLLFIFVIGGLYFLREATVDEDNIDDGLVGVKARDYLYTWIIDSFKSSGDVEAL